MSATSTRQRRSEEHTSELQSRRDLVCRLLLEKKNDSRMSNTANGTCPGQVADWYPGKSDCPPMMGTFTVYSPIRRVDPFFFFFNDTATTEIYTLSLHDALPISRHGCVRHVLPRCHTVRRRRGRSEEHTSELQSRRDLVCRLLLEKKKKIIS